jgi:hypothetical protein
MAAYYISPCLTTNIPHKKFPAHHRELLFQPNNYHMKPNKKSFRQLLTISALILFIGAVELDNLRSGFKRLKHSSLFHLPVHCVIQTAAFLCCIALVTWLISLAIKHLKQNRIPKPGEHYNWTKDIVYNKKINY